MWSESLIIICSLIALGIIQIRSENRWHHVNWFIGISLISLPVTFSISLGASPVEAVTDWSKIIGITAALTILAILIRHLKPHYTRYPFAFSFTPLVIVLFYPFLPETAVLKDLLNQLLQGGGIFITLFLFLSLKKRISNSYFFLAGAILMAAAWSVYWFSGEYALQYPWLWHLPLALGLVSFSLNGREILQNIEKD